ncbi:hypothetical protein OBBRIDRAFT_782106 [Obba rivulosa]|uniref:Uncharacterized protein n=1 Tax=Obba rivulosa TaxID=1052685 RepID=A0A8E2DHJ0_9APHY|nr:hypothetical protein OBBRIDRAFT_782106 [Obba rivulosa]
MPFKCASCQKPFGTSKAYSDHAKSKGHLFYQHVCNACSQTFVNESALQTHRTQVHSQPSGSKAPTKAVPPPTVTCSICSLTFTSTTTLQQHQHTHSAAAKTGSTSTSYVVGRCIDCSQDFGSQAGLEQHYTSSANHPTCPRCQRGVRNLAVLNAHMQLYHSTIRCDCCDASFYADEKQSHYDTSPKHPKCKICAIGFENEHSLHEHQSLKHPAAPPKPVEHQCTVCNKKFGAAIALQNHWKNSPGHPYCTPCGIRFDDYTSHRQHMEIAHPQKARAPSPSRSVPPDTRSSSISPFSVVALPDTASPPPTFLHHRAASLDGIVTSNLSIAQPAITSPPDVAVRAQVIRTVSEPGAFSVSSSRLTSPAMSDLTLDYISVHESAPAITSESKYHLPTKEDIDAFVRQQAAIKIQRAWRQRQRVAPLNPGTLDSRTGGFQSHMPTEEVEAFTRKRAAVKIQRTWRQRRRTNLIDPEHRDSQSPKSPRSPSPSITSFTPGSPAAYSPHISAYFVSAEPKEATVATQATSRTRSPESYATPSSRSRSPPHVARPVPTSLNPELIIPSDTTARPTSENRVPQAMREAHVPPAQPSRVADQKRWVRTEQSQGPVDSIYGAPGSTMRNGTASTQQSSTAPTTPKQVMWHCRICLQDPCREPTATLCGHIFCHECIVKELSRNYQCPVCKRVMLVRLHVEDA